MGLNRGAVPESFRGVPIYLLLLALGGQAMKGTPPFAFWPLTRHTVVEYKRLTHQGGRDGSDRTGSLDYGRQPWIRSGICQALLAAGARVAITEGGKDSGKKHTDRRVSTLPSTFLTSSKSQLHPVGSDYK